jgi:predicted ribosomally synthesized peptide with SipW-like signal peptide
VAVVEKKKNRRSAAIATGAVALALAVGATLASWTDSEWLKTGANGVDVGTDATNRFNLKISSYSVDEDTEFDPKAESTSDFVKSFVETGYQNPLTGGRSVAADGAFESSVQEAVELGDMVNAKPGDTIEKTIYLWNDSTYYAKLDARLVRAAVRNPVDSPFESYLTVDFDVYRPTVDDTTKKITNWTTINDAVTRPTFAADPSYVSLVTQQNAIGPGKFVKVVVTVTFDENASLNSSPSAVQGLQTDVTSNDNGPYKFLIQFTGTDTVLIFE